jgi:hypothetical protein
MAVYNPTGSGGVHTDKVISGGRGRVAKGMGFKAAAASVARKQGISQQGANAIIAAGARNASPKAKKANPNLKKVTVKKAAPKKAPAKAMADTAVMMATCAPGSSSGMGAVKAPRRKAPKMAEPGITTARQARMEHTTAKRAVRTTRPTGKKPPSQSRIPGGTSSTTGSRTN